MRDSQALQLLTQALWLVLALSGPPIAAASIVGLLMAVFQSATQLQEQTLQYAAKLVAVVLVLFATAAMIGSGLFSFTSHIFTSLPQLVRP